MNQHVLIVLIALSAGAAAATATWFSVDLFRRIAHDWASLRARLRTRAEAKAAEGTAVRHKGQAAPRKSKG